VPRWLELAHIDEEEQIDDPNASIEDLASSMEDVAQTNRFFGGTHSVISAVSRLLHNVPPGRTVRVLDIATGTADIPIALARWSSWHGIRLQITGIDNQKSMLDLADRRIATGIPYTKVFPSWSERRERDIQLIQADAAALPFTDGSFDIATCALAFHHLGYDASVKLLKSMDRLTTRGFVVTDLRRDLPTLLAVKAGIMLIGGHPFTRHDSLASVRRSFSKDEWADLAKDSGGANIHVGSHLYYRLTMIQDKKQQTWE